MWLTAAAIFMLLMTYSKIENGMAFYRWTSPQRLWCCFYRPDVWRMRRFHVLWTRGIIFGPIAVSFTDLDSDPAPMEDAA